MFLAEGEELSWAKNPHKNEKQNEMECKTEFLKESTEKTNQIDDEMTDDNSFIPDEQKHRIAV